MKEFIEKLIGRLEEQAEQYRRRGFEYEEKGYSAMADKHYGKQCSYLHSIEIVTQLTEEYKSKTQADKIRSMSDEELADYIIFIGYDYNEKIPYCKSTPQCTEILDSGRIVPNGMCRECLVKWLQSEVE